MAPTGECRARDGALGERNDSIRRIHRGLVDQRIERSVSDFAFDDGDGMRPIIGRLVVRVNGQWMDVDFASGIKRLTNK